MSVFGRLIPWWVQPLIIVLLLVGLLGQRVQVSNAKAAADRARADLSAYKLSTSETARIAQRAADQKKFEDLARVKEAADAAKKRDDGLRANAAGARAELDRLRGAIAAATRRDPVPGTTPSADDQHAATAGRLLAECAAEYQSMGERAAGHASDVQTLIESWPR